MDLKKGSVVANWCLDQQLGAGGQAVVWRVRYRKDEHSPPAAMKICSGESDKARTRFSREVELLRAQNHPGIVRVRDVGAHGGRPYYVMELATTTLAHVALADSAGTRLIRESRDLLLRFIYETCLAVAQLHASGVLHRDIKPSNVLLMLDPREPSRAVISDLGIASNEEEQGGLTATHEVVGTPAFRAPEALTGRHSTKSDVYSLGKTIEAALNGGAPMEIGPGKCLRDERLTPELWNAVDDLLSYACAFDPALRFEDAAALLKAFPLTVVGLRTPSEQRGAVGPSGEIALKVAERFALSEVISRCPSGEDWATLEEIKRYSKLNEYYFSISVRRLESLKLIQTDRVDGEFGSTYSVVRPTPSGIKWADDHHEDMTAAMAEVAPKVAKGDDIPF